MMKNQRNTKKTTFAHLSAAAMLTALAAGRTDASVLALCDDVDEALRFIVEHEPIGGKGDSNG